MYINLAIILQFEFSLQSSDIFVFVASNLLPSAPPLFVLAVRFATYVTERTAEVDNPRPFPALQRFALELLMLQSSTSLPLLYLSTKSLLPLSPRHPPYGPFRGLLRSLYYSFPRNNQHNWKTAKKFSSSRHYNAGSKNTAS